MTEPLKPSSRINEALMNIRRELSGSITGTPTNAPILEDVRREMDQLSDRLDALEYADKTKECKVHRGYSVSACACNKKEPAPAKSCHPSDKHEIFSWYKKLLVEAGVKDVDAILTKPDAVREPNKGVDYSREIPVYRSWDNPEGRKRLAGILEKTNVEDGRYSPCELLAKAAIDEVCRVLDETDLSMPRINELKQAMRDLL